MQDQRLAQPVNQQQYVLVLLSEYILKGASSPLQASRRYLEAAILHSTFTVQEFL